MPVPDFSPGEVLTAAAMDSIGLWLIETKDVTTAGTIDFTSVFSSNYSGYRLNFEYTQVTTNGNINFQFRDSGGAIGTSTYLNNWSGQYTAGGVPTLAGYSYNTSAITAAFLCNCVVGSKTSGQLDFFNPTSATPTHAVGAWASIQASPTVAQVAVFGNITHNASVARTGIRLTTSAGTVTGKFSLYGYRN